MLLLRKFYHKIVKILLIYLFIRNLEFVFPPSILLPLLSQSNNIPLLFAIITSTGHVYLEEFTDALKSLDWNLPVGLIPNTITSNSTTMLESLTNNSNNSNINNIVNDDNDNDSNNINKNNLDEDIISNETSNIISNEEIINEQSNKVVSQLNEFIS